MHCVLDNQDLGCQDALWETSSCLFIGLMFMSHGCPGLTQDDNKSQVCIHVPRHLNGTTQLSSVCLWSVKAP